MLRPVRPVRFPMRSKANMLCWIKIIENQYKLPSSVCKCDCWNRFSIQPGNPLFACVRSWAAWLFPVKHEVNSQYKAQRPNKHWESWISISDQHSVKYLMPANPQRKSSGLAGSSWLYGFPLKWLLRVPGPKRFIMVPHMQQVHVVHLKFGLWIFERMLCPSAVPPRCALGFEVAPRSWNPSSLPKLSSVP